MLKIKRTNLDSEYEVVGHNWDGYGDGKISPIYIYKSCDDGAWTDNYIGGSHQTLRECKADVFELLNTNGLVA